jgi:hypothetical protein
MFNEREQSVKHLASLYTVVIGVALSSSIYHLIDPDKGIASISKPSLILFIAFIFLIFPFYHGAMRHLDSTYLTSDSKDVRDYALLVDILLLFTHGVFFVVISMLLKQPDEFLLFIMIILAIDVVWGFMAHLAFSPDKDHKAETSWAKINLAALIFMFIFSLVEENTLNWLSNKPINYCSIILVIVFVRTLADYGMNWKFYFPKK